MIFFMRFICLFAATTLFGCAIVADDTSETSSNVVAHNRLAANRLAANRLAANRLAANRLGTTQLSNGTALSDSANDLLATADGREVLTYLVSCALPTGTNLIASDNTEFDGEIGVAPQWLDGQLDPDGQRWVSACVFARVSDLDVAIPISMRGPNDALQASADEVANWTIQQGAFYGLLFTGDSASGPEWLACSGADAAEAETVDRICASPDPANPGFTKCGFVYTGACRDASRHDHGHHYGQGETNTSACRDFNSKGTYFEDCSGFAGPQSLGPSSHGGSSNFSQVVTVYAHP
jgi:hypothetical protein